MSKDMSAEDIEVLSLFRIKAKNNNLTDEEAIVHLEKKVIRLQDEAKLFEVKIDGKDEVIQCLKEILKQNKR